MWVSPRVLPGLLLVLLVLLVVRFGSHHGGLGPGSVPLLSWLCSEHPFQQHTILLVQTGSGTRALLAPRGRPQGHHSGQHFGHVTLCPDILKSSWKRGKEKHVGAEQLGINLGIGKAGAVLGSV